MALYAWAILRSSAVTLSGDAAARDAAALDSLAAALFQSLARLGPHPDGARPELLCQLYQAHQVGTLRCVCACVYCVCVRVRAFLHGRCACVCVCVCVVVMRVFVRACLLCIVCACVLCVRACECVRACVCVFVVSPQFCCASCSRTTMQACVSMRLPMQMCVGMRMSKDVCLPLCLSMAWPCASAHTHTTSQPYWHCWLSMD